jgi:hypothetical protein
MSQQTIDHFSPKSISELKYYVYVYSDPDTGLPFYVGKGKGNRVFAHLSDTGENDKVHRIGEIRSRGKEPIIEILVHGMDDEETALKVESAAIDLIGIKNLTNQQRGHHARMLGKIDVATLEARYSRTELTMDMITDNLMMVIIHKSYRNNLTPFELYDITRGCWEVRLENAKKVDFVCAVNDQAIVEVYSIDKWIPVASMSLMRPDDYHDPSVEGRYEFVGKIAPDEIRTKYVNKDVSKLYTSRRPFQYFFGKENRTRASYKKR